VTIWLTSGERNLPVLSSAKRLSVSAVDKYVDFNGLGYKSVFHISFAYRCHYLYLESDVRTGFNATL
jgi:hypothetical protein